MPSNAASSVLKTRDRNLVPIIPYDIKLIQYKYSIYKLQEIIRILNLLEKNLASQRPNMEPHAAAFLDEATTQNTESAGKNGSTIIPLLNYILCLCEGHIFNISPLMRKRFELLCQCKHCKLQDLNPPLTITTIDLLINFHHVTINNFEHLQEIIYDVDTQWRLLYSLRTISNNALVIYNKKLRQLQLERASNSHRPYEITEPHSTFNINVVEDLIRPAELILALDFAVLINNKDKDTSLTSFLKLQWQVINKYINFIQKKILPQIKQCYNQLNKYSTQSNEPTIMTNYEFTIHRIYALTLKIYNLLTITICITRQIYLPNKNYFQNLKVKLISENVYEYENVIDHIDDICLKSMDGSVNEFYQQLNNFIDLKHLSDPKYISKNKNAIIVELYKDIVQKNVNTLRCFLHSMDSWIKIWKFIKTNTTAIEKFAQYDTEQLIKLVDERRAVDKLTFVENSKKLKVKSNTLTIDSNFSTAVSSMPTSPSNSRDINGVKLTNVAGGKETPSSSLMKLKIFNSPTSNSPKRNSRRGSVDRTNKMGKMTNSASRNSALSHMTGSGSNSPLVSRRASIIDRTSAVRPMISIDQSSPITSSSGTPTKQPSSPSMASPLKRNLTAKNRKRSSSLQSQQSKFLNSNGLSNTNIYKSLPTELKRSNSMEASDALNQKLVQDTMKKLMSSNLSTHITDPDGTFKGKTRSGSSSATLTRSRSSSVNSSISTEIFTNEKCEKDVQVKATCRDESDKDDYNNPSLEKLSLGVTIESDSEMETITADVIKKVRFIGVPPMTAAENPKPKRKGWYKKPAVLRYPPIPSSLNCAIRSKFNQEGIAFRSSLRDNTDTAASAATGLAKGSFALLNEEVKSGTHRLGFLRDKFK